MIQSASPSPPQPHHAGACEVNFDGLVGPTHNYAGLSYGNLASQRFKSTVSNPRRAALEGLAKMKLLAGLGLKQAVLPPQERPDVHALRRLGFGAPDVDDATVLQTAHREAPHLLAACCSASSMWAANAATVSPGPDTLDGRLHLTPANLISNLHRSLEAPTTAAIFRAIFPDPACFAHHAPLPGTLSFGDEGAANHTRLGAAYDAPGVELFAYGRTGLNRDCRQPSTFPARQTLEASKAIARLHRLDPGRTLFLRQNALAIDAGVFHNDVVCVGNLNVLLCHELAFYDGPAALDAIRRAFAKATGQELIVIQVSHDDVPLADAVKSYLFNSQLVSLPDETMALIAPAECQECPSTSQWLQRIVDESTPIKRVYFVDTRQSMQNGGGPACLRLRVLLTAAQLTRTHPGVLLTDTLYEELTRWIQRHYREQLAPQDLADPHLLEESRAALDELTDLLGLGDIYPFQQRPTPHPAPVG